MFPLSTVIKIDVKPEPNRLPQFNQMNAATISAVLKPGVTMGQAVSFMQAQKLNLANAMAKMKQQQAMEQQAIASQVPGSGDAAKIPEEPASEKGEYWIRV